MRKHDILKKCKSNDQVQSSTAGKEQVLLASLSNEEL
jgi:hypothetical protein